MTKSIFIVILLTTIPTLLFSQNKQLKKLYKEYENTSGFDLSTGTSNTDFDFDVDNDFFDLLNNIEDIYILNYEGNKNKSSFEKFKSKFDKIVDKNDYKPLIDISNDGSFRVLIKRDSKNNASSIILINENEDGAMYLVAVNK